LQDFDYKPVDGTLLYVKWSRGFRAGGVDTASTGAEIWQPEKLDAYELGLKQSLHGAVSGYFNAAAFYNDFTNQQEVATLQNKATLVNVGNTIVNAGKSRIDGVELESGVTVFDRVLLSASYAYLDTKLQRLVVPFSPIFNYTVLAVQGDPLPLVPKNRVTLTATYKLPLDRRFGVLSFGPTYTHTDRQLITRTTLPQYNYLPSTDLLNLNANWDNVLDHSFDVALFMTNVTDKHYPVVIGGSYNSLGYESVQWGQPRMYGIRVRYNFGR
jgi:iron complex outermembrane receptor protein